MSPLFPRCLVRAALRWQLAHPGQMALAVAGVAAGVAAVVAIELANASAAASFTRSVEALAGRATHAIVAGSSGVDEALYARLRCAPHTARLAAAPAIEHAVTVRGPNGKARTLRLTGVDPFADGGVRSFLAGGRASGAPLAAMLTRPGALALSTDVAAELGVVAGDPLALDVDGRDVAGALALVVVPNDSFARAALGERALCDIATAQELVGRVGRIDRIDLVVPEGDPAAAAALAAVASALPPGHRLEPANARTGQLEQMVRAFRLNLRALSLLALLVGAFLIYNAASFSVVRRREQLGQLRAIGAARGQILALVLAESLVVGAVGSALGAVGGAALADRLLALVGGAINDLYFVLGPTELAWNPAILARGFALGLATTGAAAFVPAWEAASTPPRRSQTRSAVEDRWGVLAPRAALAGVALAGLAIPMLTGASRSLSLAFAGLAAVVAAGALFAPAFVRVLMRALAPVMGRAFGPLGRAAARGVDASLSRTAIATAALALALAVVIGVGTMVSSFRIAITAWLGDTLGADLYIAPPSLVSRKATATLEPALAREIVGLPGIRRAASVRRVEAQSPGGPVQLVALEAADSEQLRLDLAGVSRDAAWAALVAGEVLVSEPLAFHHGVAAGDMLALDCDRGRRDFRIAAVYRDYASDEGAVTIHRDTYERWWDDRGRSAISLDLAPGATLDGVRAAVERVAAGRQRLFVRTNVELRDASLEVFERTFRITDVLALIATVIALVGAVASLLSLELERARERAIFRALGATDRQVAALVGLQAALVGLAAGLLSIPIGLAMAAALVRAINRRSFGWSFDLVIDPGLLAHALALAMGAAAIAAVAPAVFAMRRAPNAALRHAFS